MEVRIDFKSNLLYVSTSSLCAIAQLNVYLADADFDCTLSLASRARRKAAW